MLIFKNQANSYDINQTEIHSLLCKSKGVFQIAMNHTHIIITYFEEVKSYRSFNNFRR